MKKNIENINRVLAEWNPIEVPQDIAAEEYKGYIPLVLQSIESRQQLMNCLEGILIDRMGLDYDPASREQSADLQAVCDMIIKAYEGASD
jgi:hypothetical protein